MQERLTPVAGRLRMVGLVLALGSVLPAGCVTTPTAPPHADARGELRFSGIVEARRDDCFFDGICSVHVAGIEVITMSGQRMPIPVWGESRGQPELGSRVEVHCRQTAPGHCTLEGSRDFHLRVLP
ncbi:hypothetical protein [Luteimonas sp. e5]